MDRSEGGLYSVIAHEIGYAIDPISFLQYIFRQTSMLLALREFHESNSSLSCDNWEKMLKS